MLSLTWYSFLLKCVLERTVRGVGVLYSDLSLLVLLFCFLLLRMPYLYGLSGFAIFLLLVLAPVFLSLPLTRIGISWMEFFSGFVPSGTPWWIAPFVCLAETISYLVRPLVLLLRPFVNLSLGAIAMFSVSSFYFLNVGLAFLLILIFFYEIFVALVHWFIVCNILSFSLDH